MRIFLTVGSQMPFDRLVSAADEWAANHPEATIFGQIGDSAFVARSMEVVAALSPEAFSTQVQRADIVLAHAGMGTVLTAMDRGKPMVLMPRSAALRETRNDHQIGTARWLEKKPGVFVANSGDDLDGALSRAVLAVGGNGTSVSCVAQGEPLSLIRLRGFLTHCVNETLKGKK